METKDEQQLRARRDLRDRRDPPIHRNIVFNEADRVLAVAILEEFESKLGMKFTDLRRREELLDKILPTMSAMHDAAMWRGQLYKWLLTTVGKFVLLTMVVGIGLALLLGAAPAVRLMLARWLTP